MKYSLLTISTERKQKAKARLQPPAVFKRVIAAMLQEQIKDVPGAVDVFM